MSKAKKSSEECKPGWQIHRETQESNYYKDWDAMIAMEQIEGLSGWPAKFCGNKSVCLTKID